MLNMSQEELISLFKKRFGKISADGKVNCNLYLIGYKHPLPNSITNINGWLYLIDYNHPLPKSIKKVDGDIWVGNDYTGLPDNIHEWDNLKKIKYFI